MLAPLAAAILALAQLSATPDVIAPPAGPAQPGDGLYPSAPGVLAPVPPTPDTEAPLPPPPPGHPQPELWRGARVGMSIPQVAALFPGFRPASATLTTRPPVPNAVIGGGAVLAANEQVFGYPALATFYFAPSGLIEVVVGVRNLRLRHTLDNVGIARDIRTGLLRYYGAPKVCLDTDTRGLVRLDCRWTTRAVQVGLSYVDYGGLSPNLDLAIRAMPPRVRETGSVFARHGVSN